MTDYEEKEVAQNINDFPSAIIPTKVLSSVLKNSPAEGNVFIAVIDKMIFIKFGNYEYSSLLLEGQFPNYQRVIPEHQASSFQVNKKDLESALKRMTIMIDKKVSRVIFKLQSGVLTLISPESELGTADEEILGLDKLEHGITSSYAGFVAEYTCDEVEEAKEAGVTLDQAVPRCQDSSTRLLFLRLPFRHQSISHFGGSGPAKAVSP